MRRATALALGVAAAAALAQNSDTTPAAAPQADACTDFDSHANGRWRASVELPPDRARIGSFDQLRIANDRLLESALAELVARPEQQTSPGLKLLAAYYRSGTDLAAIEAQGLRAVQPWLDRIDTVDRAGLPALIGGLARHRADAPLQPFVRPDLRDGQRPVLWIAQGGLGLPDRDDYLREDPRTVRIREAYRRYAQALLAAAGVPATPAQIDALMAFESQLARASVTRAQMRDPEANYHPKTLPGLRTLAPGFDWTAWLQAYAGGRNAEGLPLVLAQPLFAQVVASLALEGSLDTWRIYLRVRLLDDAAAYLPRRFADAHFDYRERALRGLQQPPRRAEALTMLIGGRTGGEPLGQTLGELYVQRAFSAEAQRRSLEMVADIRAAMRERMKRLTWMDDATRTQALAKLEAMGTKIGAPAAWNRYEGLTLRDDDFAGNLLRVSAWATDRGLAELDRPVDRGRWNTSPHIVNAFAAGGNQIVFPAGILQPPFFDANADDATNFGAIGMVIGHEITHHFDDRGRRFDAAGNLRDWWTAADAAAYRARAERVAAFYGRYEPLPGIPIAGHQTLGENISDLAGVQIAYDGLQLALERRRKAGLPVPLVDGQTPEQRFFYSYATIWRAKQRDEALANQLRTDSHSPARFRVLAPLTHLPAFAQAFGCKRGDAMVADDPITIW